VTILVIKKGVVHASVQGSMPRPYQVSITLNIWDNKEWKKVISEIADQVLHAASLLSGEIPMRLKRS